MLSIEKSGEHFRLLYDVKGRFAIHRITPEEAKYKLLKVKKLGSGNVMVCGLWHFSVQRAANNLHAPNFFLFAITEMPVGRDTFTL